MKISIEIDEKKLRELVTVYLREQLGSLPFNEDDVKIEVKSKQNYKSEWEPAAFRAILNKY